MIRLVLFLLPALALVAGIASGQPQLATPVPVSPTYGPQLAAQPDGPPVIVNQGDDQLLGQAFLNARIVTGAGKEARPIGQVTDLLFDNDGRLVAALVSVGGFLGIGDKTVAIAWSSLQRVPSPDTSLTFVTSLTRAQLEAAPAFVSIAKQKAAEKKREVLEKARESAVGNEAATIRKAE